MSSPDSLTELTNNRNAGHLRDTVPEYSKTALGKCLVFESYLSSGFVEVPEMEFPAHVVILRTGSPSIIEWRGDGRDHRVVVPPDSTSVLPAGFRRAAKVLRPLPGTALILQINPSFFDRTIGGITKGGKVELIQRVDLNDAQIPRLMESLHADVEAGSPTGLLFGESVAMALSAHIAQRYSTQKARLETYRGGLSRSKLSSVREYVDTHLGDKLELEILAGVAGVNMFHFARAFKQSTGETPHQFVLRSRIERAKEFLHNPHATVLEASARTGFVDQSHFSKVFRRVVGVAPSDYRRSA